MQRTIKTSSLILAALVLFGCSNKPREVSASVPLVTASQKKPNKKEIPNQYWELLADSQTTSLSHNKYQIQLSKLYVSALGLPCRILTIDEANKPSVKRTACEESYLDKDNKKQTAWFLEPQIIESSSYVEL